MQFFRNKLSKNNKADFNDISPESSPVFYKKIKLNNSASKENINNQNIPLFNAISMTKDAIQEEKIPGKMPQQNQDSSKKNEERMSLFNRQRSKSLPILVSNKNNVLEQQDIKEFEKRITEQNQAYINEGDDEELAAIFNKWHI